MRKQILSLLLCGALLSGSLTGCQWGQGKAEAEVPAPSPVTAEPEPAQATVPSEKDEDTVDKEETVYVEAQADGSPKKVTVEVRLRNPGDGKPIQDRSNLSDVRSTEGDEEYTRTGNVLLWDNHGADLSYKGESSQSLPVRVRMSATLDGKTLPPAQLAGRSGHLILRFDYENLTEKTVTVRPKKKKAKKGKKKKSQPKAKTYTVKVPFVAMTALFLSEDVFSNVKVTNGECMKADDQTMVLGYACPGLAESLRLADFEATEELDVPEYVEVEADVTGFELDFTATVFTPEMAGKLETDSLDDLDELAQGLDELSDATGKLSDATGKLSKGLKKFQSYLRKYTKAVHAVRKGSVQLRKGLRALNRQTAKLQEQMEELSAQLPEAETQQAEQKTPAELLLEAQSTLDKLSSFAQGVENYAQAVEDAKGSALASLNGIDWSGLEADAAAAAQKQVQEECASALGELNLTDEEKDALTRRLTGCIDLTGVTADAQEANSNAAAALEEIPDASSLFQGAQSLGKTVGELQGVLTQLEPYAESLPALKELSASAAAYVEGVEQLSDGAGQLSGALKQLDGAGHKLNKGFSGTVKGARKLAKGVKKFDEEVVEELNGKDVEELALRLRAVRQAGKAYQSFTGLPDGCKGSVRFIIETEEIREKK